MSEFHVSEISDNYLAESPAGDVTVFIAFVHSWVSCGSTGDRGAIAPPLKPTKVNFFAMLLYNSERHLTAN